MEVGGCQAFPEDYKDTVSGVTQSKKVMNMLTARDPLAANNERVKLFASFVNAVALGLIGFAILRPLVEDIANASLSALWWGLTGLALHGFSHYILGLIRKEVKE